MRRAFFFVLLLGCAEPSENPPAIRPQRQAVTRFVRVDSFARLYVGRSLRPDELAPLRTKGEAAVVDALARHPEFKRRYSARYGDWLETIGEHATSKELDPDAPLGDVRFARWLVESLAPRIAGDVMAKHAVVDLSYRELLDAIRSYSKGAP